MSASIKVRFPYRWKLSGSKLPKLASSDACWYDDDGDDGDDGLMRRRRRSRSRSRSRSGRRTRRNDDADDDHHKHQHEDEDRLRMRMLVMRKMMRRRWALDVCSQDSRRRILQMLALRISCTHRKSHPLLRLSTKTALHQRATAFFRKGGGEKLYQVAETSDQFVEDTAVGIPPVRLLVLSVLLP